MRDRKQEIQRDQWRALVRGDERALGWLFDNFSQGLFNYGMKIVADRELVRDCIQDLFSEIWKNHRRLTVPDAPKLYLLKALKFKVLRESFRQHKRSAWHERHRESEFESCAETVMIADQMSVENHSAVRSALNKLTQRQREVLVLRYFEDLSHDEIAELLQLNKQSVYNLIFSALTSLRKLVLPEMSTLPSLLSGCAVVNLLQ